MPVIIDAIDCVAHIPTKWASGQPVQYLMARVEAELVIAALIENGFGIVDVEVLKSTICDCLIAINNDVDPVTRDKWGPIIPPTSIDWIGDALVAAIVNRDPIHIEDHYNGEA